MIAALVVSWAGPGPATSAGRALERGRDLFTAEIGAIVCDVALSPVEHLLVAAAAGDSFPDLHHDAATGRMAIVCSTTADTSVGRTVAACSLARDGGDCLVDVVPPFGACWRTGHDQPVHATTDRCGLAPLYAWQGGGLAAMCTSSVLLAMAAEIELDEQAIGAFAMLGHHVGSQTWYPDVRKLQVSQLASVRCGRLTITAPITRGPTPPDDVLADGRAALEHAVHTALEIHPDAAIELSGGMDSRAVLAAVPLGRRAGMTAITLGAPDTPDVTVARRLAERCGLHHQVIDITPLAAMEPTAALALATTAGRRRDFGRDAVGAAVLDWVEQRASQQARLTGQGGEFLRGHYYAGQPTDAIPSPELVGRLGRWRLFTVGAADPALFAPTFLEAARRDTTRRLWDELDGSDGDWLSATDELYLRVRMQRWAGSEYSPAALRRAVLAPYFHPRVIDWGRRTTSTAKGGGKALNALTVALDPVLGDIALDTGLRPRDLAAPGWRTRAALAAAAGRQLTRKVRRRIGPATSATVGATDVARLVTAAWATSTSSLERVAALPCMDAATVLDVAAGRRRVGPASIAFLVGLDGVLASAAQ